MEKNLSAEIFFSVADITGFFVFTAMNMLKIEIPDDCNNVKKWRDKLLLSVNHYSLIRPFSMFIFLCNFTE